MSLNITNALNWGIKKLGEASSSPALDAEVLLSHVLHKDKIYLYTNPTKKLTQILNSKFKVLIRKRARHWPVAYLTGHKEFCGLDFKVTPDVLIPRPETELLVEQAIRRIMNHELRIKNVIDLGTGSGCIIISITKSLVEYAGLVQRTPHFFAVDSLKSALRIARLNAHRHGMTSKIKFLQGDLLCPILKSKIINLKSSLIIANLPYLTKKQLNNLTIKHEPKNALYGGKDGLKYLRELFKRLSGFCHCDPDFPSGEAISRKYEIALSSRRVGTPRNDIRLIILLEHDPRQKQKLTHLTKKYFPCAGINFHKDLAQKPRVLEIFLPML